MGACVPQMISMACGAVVGCLVSVLVNEAMLQISTNAFFSVIFGFVLLVMGCVILWRIHAQAKQMQRHEGGGGIRQSSSSKHFVACFAVLVIVSGLFCFVLEKNWFTTVSYKAKIPMYSLLGVALWFALSFITVDLLNYFAGCCLPNNTRPFVSTASQICLVLLAAILLGIYFGVVFGTLDVEDDVTTDYTSLRRDAMWTVPVGAIVGSLVSCVNYVFLRPPSTPNFDI